MRVRSRLRMVDHIPEAPRRQVRIDEGLAALDDCPGGDAVCLQEMHGLIMIPRQRPGSQELVEFGLMIPTCEYGRKSGILCQVWLTDGLAQPALLVVGADGDGDPHIIALAGIDTLRHHVWVSVTQRTRHTASHRVVHHIFP